MFKDLVLLTRALCKYPEAHINIHLIHPNFSYAREVDETAYPLLRILRSLFPRALVSLSLYDSPQEYCTCGAPKNPDVIVGVDITDEIEKNVPANKYDLRRDFYDMLCVVALHESKSLSKNVLLTKCIENQLTSVSLINNGGIEFINDLGQNQKCRYYIKTMPLKYSSSWEDIFLVLWVLFAG